ncbi:glycosyl transferase family, a/b domain-containing protein [Melampsora americana]|nr:glycosyl transferase family, a/b domain-containing protein [Melampsora americana]
MTTEQTIKPLLRSILEFAQTYHSNETKTIPDKQIQNIQQILSLIKEDNIQNLEIVTQIGSLLGILSVTGLDQNHQILSTFANQIHQNWSKPLSFPRPDSSAFEPICDIVGTGGDGFNTFNVSTASAIVAAGAGLKVCKHGNRASSSSTGSADLIIAQGIRLPSLSNQDLSKILSSTHPPNFTFLFSPSFYPIFLTLSPLRKSLGFPTIFNLLGPLLNPSKPNRILIGVSKPQLGPIISSTLVNLKIYPSWVVCGKEGLDEISPSGLTQVWKIDENGSISESMIEPFKDFGLQAHSLQDVIGGEVEENSSLLNDLLNNKIDSNRLRAIQDFVLLNSAALLLIGGKALDLKDGVNLAKHSLESGNAKLALNEFKKSVLDLSKVESNN